jgi:hypothetical protein
LSAEMRAAILALKREVQQDARYAAAGVHSRYVYHAALEGSEPEHSSNAG